MNPGHIVVVSQFPASRTKSMSLSVRSVTLLVAAILLAMQLTASAQTWQTLLNPPPLPEIIDPVYNYDLGPGGASNPMLLTDGSVIIRSESYYFADSRVFKLTPDQTPMTEIPMLSEVSLITYVAATG